MLSEVVGMGFIVAFLPLERIGEMPLLGFSFFYFAPFQPSLRRCSAEVGVGYPWDGSREYPTPTFYAGDKDLKRNNALPALISMPLHAAEGWLASPATIIAHAHRTVSISFSAGIDVDIGQCGCRCRPVCIARGHHWWLVTVDTCPRNN